MIHVQVERKTKTSTVNAVNAVNQHHHWSHQGAEKGAEKGAEEGASDKRALFGLRPPL